MNRKIFPLIFAYLGMIFMEDCIILNIYMCMLLLIIYTLKYKHLFT